MFEPFLSAFQLDSDRKEVYEPVSVPIQAEGFQSFFEIYAGCSFNKGLYRIHSCSNIGKWNQLAKEAFPNYADRIFCFSSDWLGRQFALDANRTIDGESLLLMFEPGTGEVLEIPATFTQFHNEELVNHTNAALASDFYQEWLSNDQVPPSNMQCIGYIIPLFLLGSDTIDNLERTDFEVYWGLYTHISDQIQELPPGTSISNFTIE